LLTVPEYSGKRLEQWQRDRIEELKMETGINVAFNEVLIANFKSPASKQQHPNHEFQ
jgi:hypothetical protein